VGFKCEHKSVVRNEESGLSLFSKTTKKHWVIDGVSPTPRKTDGFRQPLCQGVFSILKNTCCYVVTIVVSLAPFLSALRWRWIRMGKWMQEDYSRLRVTATPTDLVTRKNIMSIKHPCGKIAYRVK